ncbi:unnamed protein product [Ilex paraguariensis]|uniref:Uncharacterized protein n=1 Tax=Ilex paraguariensis TaxID=185542 RepID=A0ABC8TZP5_9AQUA
MADPVKLTAKTAAGEMPMEDDVWAMWKWNPLRISRGVGSRNWVSPGLSKFSMYGLHHFTIISLYYIISIA